MRPEGTDGLSEDELAGWVTRDCMIGTGLPTAPSDEGLMTASERKNKTHDMGGQPGGPIPIDPPEGPVFAEDWQARALAITVAAGGLGKWNLDSSRHARERLPAADYQAYSYYEKWLAGLATLLVETGLVSTDELPQGPGAPRCGPARGHSPPQLNRWLPLLPVAGRLCVLTGPRRALPLASGSQFLTRIRLPLAQTAIPACRPIVRAVQARSSAITTAMFCLTATHTG